VYRELQSGARVVRLIGRGGHDWAKDFPLIIAAATKLRQQQFVIDGEIVVLN
jgi:bifunctional non-homologous end joining protein LigD